MLFARSLSLARFSSAHSRLGLPTNLPHPCGFVPELTELARGRNFAASGVQRACGVNRKCWQCKRK